MVRTGQARSLTEGPPGRLIFFFSLPVCLESGIRMFLTTIANMIVGRGLGVPALAAVGAALYGYNPFNWLCFGFSQCISVAVAQYFGYGKGKRLREGFSTVLRLGIIDGIVISVLGALLAVPMLRLLGTPSDIYDITRQYLLVMNAGNICFILYDMMSGCLRAVGDAVDPVIGMVIMGVSQIGLTYFFVYILHLGVYSAALALHISYLVSAAYGYSVLRKMKELRRQEGDARFSLSCVREVLPQSISYGFQLCTVAIGGILMQRAFNRAGSVYTAAFTAASSLHGVPQGMMQAFGHVMNAYVSQNYGAGKLRRIKEGYRAAILMGAGLCAGIALILILAGRPLLTLYVKGEESAEVLGYAYHFLVIMSVGTFVLYILQIHRSGIIGLGRANQTVFGNLGEVAGRGLTSDVFKTIAGLPGIFFAEVGAWTISGVLHAAAFWTAFRKIAKQHPEMMNGEADRTKDM